jgi:hypothetical protein
VSYGLAATREWCKPVSGIGDDVFDNDPDGYREEFLYAVEVARALHDPAEDWEAFRDVLWANLTRVFGIEDPASLPGVAGSDLEPGVGVGPGADPLRPAGGADQRSAARPRA